MDNKNDIALYTDGNYNLTNQINAVINKFWEPNKSVIKIIENMCLSNNYVKILEVGPGFVPFSLATDFIGCNENIKNYIDIDIDKDKFPYEDNTFDFIYCRHVLEDIQNPDFALKEIFRISSGCGYIETPSPLIEITKNVDGMPNSSLYSGYIHHRYIVWSNIEKNEIYFLPKYSCILDNILSINDNSKSYMYSLINNYPIYWNNYFIYNASNKPKVIMYKNGVNFNIKNTTMIEEYLYLIGRAVNESIENTNYFIRMHNN